MLQNSILGTYIIKRKGVPEVCLADVYLCRYSLFHRGDLIRSIEDNKAPAFLLDALCALVAKYDTFPNI